MNLTPRERFIAALERKQLSGQVPQFELVFFLTMQAFGKVPPHWDFSQWLQMEELERNLHRQTNPHALHSHALHSLDPQAGDDIAEGKRLYGDRADLIGNVDCSALYSDTVDDVYASASYALKSGFPGGGYIFSTCNCIYTGLPLARFELMLDVWRREGLYPDKQRFVMCMQ